jgi:crossover junction endodeoxyribonuclease RusA
MTTYRIPLPWGKPPLTANQRLYWAQRCRLTYEIRRTVAWLAKGAQIPTVEHLTVQLIWAPGDRRKRDEDNLWPTLKACCDALARGRPDLTGLDLVPDDTSKYMTKLSPRILPPPEPAGMWLEITTGPREVT